MIECIDVKKDVFVVFDELVDEGVIIVSLVFGIFCFYYIE